MLEINLSGKSVLITGGTRGIGLATGLAFGKAGAHVYLTHKWGSSDESAIRQQFADVGAPAPGILQADVAEKADTADVMKAIAEQHDRLDAFVSNVGFALVTPGFEDYKLKSFQRTIEYTSWPLVSHLRAAKKQFGQYPRYAVGISSDGPDSFYPGYDFVATSKAVLETFARYISGHLLGEGCYVNIVRAGIVLTDSFKATFGEDFHTWLNDHGRDFCVDAQEVGNCVLACCSGLMDSMAGHVLVIDKGSHLRDNIINLMHQKKLIPNPEG